MSDYLFTSVRGKASELTKSIKQIYNNLDITCEEFEGKWGSLSVSHSPYKGLQPLETESHIFIVLGAPVLYFRDNRFLIGNNPTEGSQALLERFLANKLDCENDISGPFQFMIVDKTANKITLITDLMSFIPAYQHLDGVNIAIGSHVDALARVTGTTKELDKVALVDFILHGVVTYPHTFYGSIKQLQAAKYHEYFFKDNQLENVVSQNAYWLPTETSYLHSKNEAAESLNEGVNKYVNALTENMTQVAQFISGGEDSRVVAGLIPRKLKRDGYIFLNAKNREAKLAFSVAKKYDCTINLGLRTVSHYLDIVDEASNLVGAGHEYMNCHSLGFADEFKLERYPAVFGGYISDTLLKGYCAPKITSKFRLGIFPERTLKDQSSIPKVKSDIFSDDLINELNKRRAKHASLIRNLRPLSSGEWFYIWPATMRAHITNHYCNRRLFASYEIFMSHEVVKLAAMVPLKWKVDRSLFRKAFKLVLKPSKWVPHSNGGLPYFSHYSINMLIKPFFRFYYVINRIIKPEKDFGAWINWYTLKPEFDRKLSEYNDLAIDLFNMPVGEIVSQLSKDSQLRLLQTLLTSKKS